MDKQREAVQEVKNMNAFERAQRKYYKNKLHNDAYAQKAEEAKTEEKKSSVQKCFLTITIKDRNGEHSHTWEAPQLTGTILPSQQRKDWYMQTAKEILQKSFGRLV